MKLDYKSAGVDVEAGYKSVSLIKKHSEKTYSAAVLSGIGGFGGLYSIKAAKDMDDPVLVSSTDGVGTKLKIAFLMDKHDTVGIDCVAMCANDIVCSGAKPLFFLDYIACGKNYPEKIESIVKGIANGCNSAGMSLIGGETAEHPGLMREDEYDIAGFCVGIVDKQHIIDGSTITSGDTVIGIASSGLHSNGFSLVRSLLRPGESNIKEYIETFSTTLGEELLRPTKIYVKPILECIAQTQIKGIANITGGGFYENIPRVFPSGLTAKIELNSWPVPRVFSFLTKYGKLEKEVLYGTFNMGIGMVLIADKNNAEKVISILREFGENAYVIGTVTEGDALIL